MSSASTLFSFPLLSDLIIIRANEIKVMDSTSLHVIRITYAMKGTLVNFLSIDIDVR